MKRPETAAQILLRTCLRYYPIRHLDLPTKKHLMALNDEDFKAEVSLLGIALDEQLNF
jgi:hypothetical protein